MANRRKGSRSSASRPRNATPGPSSTVSDGSQPLLADGDGASPVSDATVVVRRRFNIKRALLLVGAVLLVLILIGFGYAYWMVQKSLPTTSGTIKLPGLSAPVTVTRDVYGVPHIVAANMQDAFEAEGYVHAQDRLFQMFYFRALGEGRLAEAFGSAALQPDIFLRTIGIRRAAEADMKLLTPQTLGYLQAYSRGVNEFLRTHADSMPLEFTILGLKMEDWQPVDTIAFGKVMAWDLSTNWDTELVRADLENKLGPQRAQELFPEYPSNGPFIVPGTNSGSAGPALEAFNRIIRPWLPGTGLQGLGSNNWVVDGTKSATGSPLLSNDPHLGVQNPSIWYEIQLSTTDGKYNADGFGFAGAPGIVTGHNQNIAWGVTNTEADVQDLFIEKLDPGAHPGQYLTADGWKPLQTITETIQVKGAAPVTQTVRLTQHGPIITDALTAISSTIGSSITQTLSFEWAAAQPGGTLIDALASLQTASNWQEFRAALSKWDVPGQNFVYADKQGNIGYQMTGKNPIRKKGDGQRPVPGWTGEYDWNGFVPFNDLPTAYNPPEHFIATANNKSFGANYNYPIQAEWAPPWRISEIVNTLKSKDKLSADDFKALLMDTKSPVATKMAPILANLKPTDPTAQQAVKALSGWDGNLTADSVPATIYEVTVQEALSQTLNDDLGINLLSEYMSTDGAEALRSLELMLDKPDDPFWDRTDTPQKETMNDTLLASLNSATQLLAQGLGDDVTQWTWGKLHTITPAHPVLGSIPLLSGIFNLPSAPMGGDGTTVSVGTFSRVEPFAIETYQSYRMIIDVGDWTKSQAILATGESGQPFSKHWGDMYSQWQQGQFNPMLYTAQQIDANKEAVLTFTP